MGHYDDQIEEVYRRRREEEIVNTNLCECCKRQRVPKHQLEQVCNTCHLDIDRYKRLKVVGEYLKQRGDI